MSESEGEEVVAQEVTLPQDLPGRGNVKSSQCAVRLTEVYITLYRDVEHCVSVCVCECVCVAGSKVDAATGKSGGRSLQWRGSSP